MDIISKAQGYFLRAAEKNENACFRIPKLWNQFGYDAISAASEQEIMINPYAFSAALLAWLPEAGARTNSFSLDESIIYASLVRYTSAWDYDGSGCCQSGTFLRMIWLLPMLQKMGVNILYLLPVTRCVMACQSCRWKMNCGC